MNENTLFYESFSRRYFRSNIDKINTIINKAYMTSMKNPNGLPINTLYNWLGLEEINMHNGVSWSNYKDCECMMDADDYIISPTGEVAIYIDYLKQPS